MSTPAEAGGLGVGLTLLGGALYEVYTAVNHHKLRVSCCGKELSASVDIDPTDTVIKVPSTSVQEP